MKDNTNTELWGLNLQGDRSWWKWRGWRGRWRWSGTAKGDGPCQWHLSYCWSDATSFLNLDLFQAMFIYRNNCGIRYLANCRPDNVGFRVSQNFEILTFWNFDILTFWHFDILTFDILTFWHFDIWHLTFVMTWYSQMILTQSQFICWWILWLSQQSEFD